MFYTYKITNNITGEYYIGSHESDDFLNDNYYGSGKKIKESVKKYGKENHTKEIIQEFNNWGDAMNCEHSIVKEKRQIEKDPKILNLNNGGGFIKDYCTHEERVKYAMMSYDKLLQSNKDYSERVKKEYYANPKICENCGVILPYEKRRNKFCSSSCAATLNNKLYTKKHMKPQGSCLVCGKRINARNKFCSIVCKNEYRNWKDSLKRIAIKVPEKYHKYYADQDKYNIKEFYHHTTAYGNYLMNNKDKILEERSKGITYKELGTKYECSEETIREYVNKWKKE